MPFWKNSHRSVVKNSLCPTKKEDKGDFGLDFRRIFWVRGLQHKGMYSQGGLGCHQGSSLLSLSLWASLSLFWGYFEAQSLYRTLSGRASALPQALREARAEPGTRAEGRWGWVKSLGRAGDQSPKSLDSLWLWGISMRLKEACSISQNSENLVAVNVQYQWKELINKGEGSHWKSDCWVYVCNQVGKAHETMSDEKSRNKMVCFLLL